MQVLIPLVKIMAMLSKAKLARDIFMNLPEFKRLQ
jgi:hypothetical protein